MHCCTKPLRGGFSSPFQRHSAIMVPSFMKGGIHMSKHIEEMRFEMQLRCYAVSSQKHYLSQIRLVEKYFNKSVPELNVTEIRSYFHNVICQGKSYDYKANFR